MQESSVGRLLPSIYRGKKSTVAFRSKKHKLQKRWNFSIYSIRHKEREEVLMGGERKGQAGYHSTGWRLEEKKGNKKSKHILSLILGVGI